MSRILRTIVIVVLWLLTFILSASRAPAAAPVDESREQELYDRGSELLDKSDWDGALAAFAKAAAMEGRRADGALYWKAYAQNKLNRRGEALKTLEELRRSFPESRWLDDSKVLEVEIRQAGGRPVAPEKEDDEELKLVALNGLMNMDPEKAVPLLEKFLSGSTSPRLKEQALFVLVQTGSPRAREIVGKIARGQASPDLQRKALEYLGVFGGGDSRRLLKEVYGSSSDASVKRSVLQAFMISDDTDSLLAAARGEEDSDLRLEAIQLLGAAGAREELAQLYKAQTDVEVKEKILQALAICEGGKELMEAARTEKDPRLRRAAIRGMGLLDGDEAGPLLISLYESEKELEIRSAVLDALFLQDNDAALIGIARKETDPRLRKAAVEKLALMESEEATKFMLEILNK